MILLLLPLYGRTCCCLAAALLDGLGGLAAALLLLLPWPTLSGRPCCCPSSFFPDEDFPSLMYCAEWVLGVRTTTPWDRARKGA